MAATLLNRADPRCYPVGHCAAELVNTAALAIRSGTTIDDFNEVVFVHPSARETMRLCAGKLGSSLRQYPCSAVDADRCFRLCQSLAQEQQLKVLSPPPRLLICDASLKTPRYCSMRAGAKRSKPAATAVWVVKRSPRVTASAASKVWPVSCIKRRASEPGTCRLITSLAARRHGLRWL
jgi:Pyridine nucleotide-disulphide oxidoreductase, dimerisation domain